MRPTSSFTHLCNSALFCFRSRGVLRKDNGAHFVWNLSWSFSFNVNKFSSFVCALWNILPHLNRLVRASPRRSLWLTGTGITTLTHNVPHLEKQFHFSWTNKQPQSLRNLLSSALESGTKVGSSSSRSRPPGWHRLSIFHICLNLNIFCTFEPAEVERQRLRERERAK